MDADWGRYSYLLRNSVFLVVIKVNSVVLRLGVNFDCGDSCERRFNGLDLTSPLPFVPQVSATLLQSFIDRFWSRKSFDAHRRSDAKSMWLS